ncbi:MAG: metallophosphoesterase [Proteobacteria bacterium]|nr:metallophosphoesterase [Pseudomonadota bacterium]
MSDIQFVCLSDMHFGAETSLLTNLKTASSEINPLKPSPVLEKLVDCLSGLISGNQSQAEKPTLILNGDILEIALARTNEAAMAFERFIELIAPKDREPLFDRIIYNPGNHDHHLWEMARETQYVENVLKNTAWGSPLPVPWHATNIFKEPVPSFFLTRLIQRYQPLQETNIQTAYPNFGLLNRNKSKCIIFHHGHFIEPIYMLMSIIKTMFFPDTRIPADIWDLEAENFAWIDFFWSTLGRSEGVGQKVNNIYEFLQDKKVVKRLLSNFSKSLAEKYDLPGWGDRMEAALLDRVFSYAVDRISGLEKNVGEDVLSDEAREGFWTYMEGPLRSQVIGECNQTMPMNLAFVFGHTHKPFEKDMNFTGYPEWVDVYNTGGWVVDKDKLQPLHGGSIVLIDENLEAASVRMYNEQAAEQDYQVVVKEARHPGDQPGEFFLQIENRVAANKTLFQDFSNAAARAVNVRKENLRARIYGRGTD